MADPVVGTGKMTCIEDVDAPTKREPTGAKIGEMQNNLKLRSNIGLKILGGSNWSYLRPGRVDANNSWAFK